MPLPNSDRLWDYDHPDETRAIFETILPVRTQIARAYSLQGKFDAAQQGTGSCI